MGRRRSLRVGAWRHPADCSFLTRQIQRLRNWSREYEASPATLDPDSHTTSQPSSVSSTLTAFSPVRTSRPRAMYFGMDVIPSVPL